jgi:AcrR family transcriptional regulator
MDDEADRRRGRPGILEMPRDKSQSHIRIIEAAKKEFMEYGFTDASLRRIANEAGIQVSGLYKHFSNKEEMFAALVDPAIDGLMALYREIEKDNSDGLETEDKDSTWTDQKETVRTMEYIYDHIHP